MESFLNSAAPPRAPLSVPWGALGSRWKPALALGRAVPMSDALYPFMTLLLPFSSRHFDSFRITFSFLNGF